MRAVLLAALPSLALGDPCCTSPFVCGGCSASVDECQQNKIGCLACDCNCCNPTPPPAPPGRRLVHKYHLLPGVPTPAPASYVIDVAGHTSTVYNPNGSAVVVIYHGLNGLYRELRVCKAPPL
eukprot:gene12749-7998_t